MTFFQYEGITEKETKFLVKQKTRSNTGNTTSIDNTILENKEMKKLKQFIEKSVKEYFKNIYQPKNNVEPYITQSWCNYTKEGQFHHKHAHPNSFISGVFYVQADKTKDKIYFYKEEYKQIKVPAKEYNLFNSESWWFETGTNDLVIFPSSLIHMVEKVVGKERISLSFNTFLKGYIGEDLELTGLHIGV
ncbi:TIGR02466 family protein [Hyphomonas sp.]|uniref:TIGR02466 family protein n=1 Tax=Hyphomonas sp. TaxID=87 RepID=UPI0025C3C9DC|nr:TIGR02466 family protein [Hyphomonas sp.]